MKIVTIIGARPQIIKAAVLSRLIKNTKDVEEIIVHTGQHYDYNMSQVFFEQLDIPSFNINLNIGSGSHGEQTGKMLIDIEKVLLEHKPDIVVTYGDTNSTLAGALAAVKLHIKSAHIEAGLRSFNRKMPEEINRIVADEFADIRFCPTKEAIKNLEKEGIKDKNFLSGDVMYDAALYYRKKVNKNFLETVNVDSKNYYLLTCHRAENTDNIERLKTIMEMVGEVDKQVLFPVHPRTNKILKNVIKLPSNLKMIEPVSYIEMICLENNAKGIITDSGGVQKEAYFAEVPCITIRSETEWVETVASGWNKVVDVNKSLFLTALQDIKNDYFKNLKRENFYGDGNAGSIILEKLKQEI